MDRDTFIKNFVEAGQKSGASKEEVTGKLSQALSEYDAKFSQKKEEPFLDTVLNKINPNILKTTRGIGQDLEQRAQIAQTDPNANPVLKAANVVGDVQSGISNNPVIRETAGAFARGATNVDNIAGQENTLFAKPQTPVGNVLEGAGAVTEAFNPSSLLNKALGVGAKGKAIGAAALEKLPLQEIGRQAIIPLLQRSAVSASLGGVREAIQPGSTQKSTQDAAVNSAILSAAIPELFGDVSSAGSKLTKGLKDKAYEAYANTMKETQDAKNLLQQHGGREEVIKKAVYLNLPTTQRGVEKELEKFSPKFESGITKALASSERKGQTINLYEIATKTKEKIRSLLSNPENEHQLGQAMEYIDNYANDKEAARRYGSVLVDSVNDIRKRIDKSVGDIPYDDVSLKGKSLAMKLLAGELRNAVKTAVPETRILSDRYSLLSTLRDVYKKEHTPAGFPEIVGAAVGNVPGFLGTMLLRSPGAARTAAAAAIKQQPALTDLLKNLGVLGSQAAQRAPYELTKGF